VLIKLAVVALVALALTLLHLVVVVVLGVQIVVLYMVKQLTQEGMVVVDMLGRYSQKVDC
jgi:hypothetical protein